MELRVAAEPCVEGCIEQRDLPAGVALLLVAVEESLHALAVAELDDGEAGLLFEEATETGRTETGAACELREVVRVFIGEQQTRGALDRRMNAAYGDLAGTIEALPCMQ